jgi:hypothetical protein
MITLYDLCYPAFHNSTRTIDAFVLTQPVRVWDNLAQRARTITSYDPVNFLFSSADGMWFMGSDTHFTLEEATPAEATETTVVVAPPGPHKCTCDIVKLIQVGCQCKGV